MDVEQIDGRAATSGIDLQIRKFGDGASSFSKVLVFKVMHGDNIEGVFRLTKLQNNALGLEQRDDEEVVVETCRPHAADIVDSTMQLMRALENEGRGFGSRRGGGGSRERGRVNAKHFQPIGVCDHQLPLISRQ
jgi:hypothetical protein